MNSRSRLRSLFSIVAVALAPIFAPVHTLAAPPPGIPDGWSDGFVYANGIRIHYYHATPAAGKPVIVMLHGVSDNGLCWTTLTWKLQDQYDIYMLDARSHGLSDPSTASDTSDAAVKDVVDFLRVMKIEKPILMGHSMGGGTVIQIGATYPELAKAIIVLDAGIGAPGGPRAAGAAAASGAPKAAADDAAPPARPAPDPEAMVKQNNTSFDELVAKARRQTPKWDLVDCQYWALSKKQYHGRYTAAASPGMPGGMNGAGALAKITVPLVILKATDGITPETRKAQLEAASVMQKGKLVHIEGAGHNLHHDQLARTTEVIKEFLSTL